jgi:hypothetical protein
MNYKLIKNELDEAFYSNSETKLLKILKNNSILFYQLYSRKYGIQPNFSEVSFGDKYRCDFAWLNDNSDGPEWVLVEIEKPKMKLFTKKHEPTADLNHAIEQLKSWGRYFDHNPGEKKRIFGAVARFKYILVAGHHEEWAQEYAKEWRIQHNKDTKIEIRSSDVFYRALELFNKREDEFWSFKEHPKSLTHSKLEDYWMNYSYFNSWRIIL